MSFIKKTFSSVFLFLLALVNASTFSQKPTLIIPSAEPLTLQSVDFPNLSITKDNRYIISCGFGKSAKLWETSSGRLLHVFKSSSGETFEVPHPVYADDGSCVIIDEEADRINFYDIHSANVKFSVRGSWPVLGSSREYISSSGKYIATLLSEFDSVAVWNGVDGHLLGYLPGTAPEFAPNEKFLKIQSKDKIQIINLADMDVICTVDRTILAGDNELWTPFKFNPSSTSFVVYDIKLEKIVCYEIPDGKRLYTTSGAFNDYSGTGKMIKMDESRSNRTVLVDAHTGQVVFSIPRKGSSQISPDDRHLIRHSYPDSITIFDIQSGRSLYHLIGGYPTCSPDGRYLFTHDQNRYLKILNLTSFSEVHKDLGGEIGWSYFSSIQYLFSPNGRYVILRNDENALLVDLPTGNIALRFEGYDPFFSGDNSLIIAKTDPHLETFSIWDVKTGKLLCSNLVYPNDPTYITTPLPDGEILLSTYQCERFLKLDLTSGKISEWLDPGSGCIRYVSPDQRFVATDYYDMDQYALEEDTIKFWDIQSGKTVGWIKGKDPEFSSGWNYIAVNRGEDSIQVFNADARSFLYKLKGSSPLFSPDEKAMLTCTDEDNVLFIWNLSTGSLINFFRETPGNIISCMFSPDNRYLISKSVSTWDQPAEIRFWDISKGKLVHKCEGDPEGSMVFSPDGKHLLIDYFLEDHAYLLNIETFDTDAKLISKNYLQFTEPLFSNDGSMIYLFHDCESIGMWADPEVFESATGKRLFTLQGHDSRVTPTSFSPDGKWLYTGGNDGTVKCWEAKTGKLRFTIQHTNSEIIDDVLIDGGKRVLTLAMDRSIGLWDATTGEGLINIIRIDSVDWVHLHPSGLFDASPGAMKYLHYVVNDPTDEKEPWKVVELDQLKSRYYQPGLYQSALGMSTEPLRNVDQLADLDFYPAVHLSLKDSALLISLKGREGGIGKVEVSVDGINIIPDARALKSSGNSDSLNLTVDLSGFEKYFFADSSNTISVIVWNEAEYLRSRPFSVNYDKPASSKGAQAILTGGKREVKPALYGVIAGISDYAGDAIDLGFAAKDANVFSKALEIGAANLFGKEHVHLERLTTDAGDKVPDKKNIISAFHALSSANPDDIIVIYLSGHGVNHGGQDGDFYYLTSEMGSFMPESLNDPAIRNAYTISGEEMSNLINACPARKKILILDACSSGKAAENLSMKVKDVPPSQIRALDRMNDRTGFYVLASSAADASSFEAVEYGQGILTYAILSGIRGEALRVDGNEEYIDVARLFNYTVDKVPEIARDINQYQRPFYKSSANQKSFDIGRMDNQSKQAIPLAAPKHVFLPSRFLDLAKLTDHLHLSDSLDGCLMEKAGTVYHSIISFTNARDFPGGYAISGTYSIVNKEVEIRYILTHDDQPIGENRQVRGSTLNLADLLSRVVDDVVGQLRSGK